jgi:hypothetical protein
MLSRDTLKRPHLLEENRSKQSYLDMENASCSLIMAENVEQLMLI